VPTVTTRTRSNHPTLIPHSRPPLYYASGQIRRTLHWPDLGEQTPVDSREQLRLLPSAFLHAEGRAAFNRAHPVNGYYPVAPRPSFTRDGKGNGKSGCAWFVWDRRWRGRQRVGVLCRPQPITRSGSARQSSRRRRARATR